MRIKLLRNSKIKIYLLRISMKRETEPPLPLAALAICCAAFAILKARFKHKRTLVGIYTIIKKIK
jgi:hypothetical protein